MKRKLNVFLFLLCSLFFFVSSTLYAGNERDSVQLKGMIYNNKNRVKNVIVNIYSQNKLIKNIHVKASNRFVTYLPVNCMLTIEISAENYHTKRFMFDTNLPEGTKPIPKYDFDIDIFKEEELSDVNTSLLDFPVGLVSYDPKKKVFIRNKKYTKRMKKAYLKLWAESQAADRQGEGLD